MKLRTFITMIGGMIALIFLVLVITSLIVG